MFVLSVQVRKYDERQNPHPDAAAAQLLWSTQCYIGNHMVLIPFVYNAFPSGWMCPFCIARLQMNDDSNKYFPLRFVEFVCMFVCDCKVSRCVRNGSNLRSETHKAEKEGCAHITCLFNATIDSTDRMFRGGSSGVRMVLRW